MAPRDPPEKPLSLEQYAGVTAALAEGFEPEAVLAQEQIDARRWRESSADWKKRLTADGPDGALFASYKKALAEAEDTLHRKVTPLESDAVAWVGFLKVYSASAEPSLVLADLDLGPNDVARLTRRWDAKAESNDVVRQKLAAAAEKEPRPLRGIRAELRVLRRFPWSPEPAPAPAAPVVAPDPPKPPAKVVEEKGEQEAPSVAVPSFMRPGERVGPMVAPILAAPMASVAPEAVVPGVPPMVSAPPMMSAPPMASVPPGPMVPVSPMTSVPAERDRPEKPVKGVTSPGFVLPAGPVVPFQPGEAPKEITTSAETPKVPKASPPATRRDPLHETVNAAPPPSSLGETRMAFELPTNLPLPFKKAEPTEPAPTATPAAPASTAAPAPTASTAAARASIPLDSTAHDVQLPIKAPLPFDKTRPGENEFGYAAAGRPIVDRGERVGTGTEGVFKRPASQPVLPFAKKTEDEKPSPPAQGPEEPARPPQAQPPTPQGSSAQTPTPKASPSKGPPALSLEQHAAMSLELAVLPRHVDSVLHRYGIDAATRAELDERYRILVLESPQALAAWNRAYQAHHARWQSGRKR